MWEDINMIEVYTCTYDKRNQLVGSFWKKLSVPKNYSSWSCFCNLSSRFSVRAWIQSKQSKKQILRSASRKWLIQKFHTMKSMGFGSNSIILFLEKLKIPFIRSELFSIVHLWRESFFKENLELPCNSLAGHLLRVNKVDHHTPLANILINYDNRKWFSGDVHASQGNLTSKESWSKRTIHCLDNCFK